MEIIIIIDVLMAFTNLDELESIQSMTLIECFFCALLFLCESSKGVVHPLYICTEIELHTSCLFEVSFIVSLLFDQTVMNMQVLMAILDSCLRWIL